MIFLVIFIALFLMIIFRKNTKKVIGILVLIIGIIGGTCYFSGNGVKSYYCLPQNNCITVWKRSNGDIYIIYGYNCSGKELYRSGLGLTPPDSEIEEAFYKNKKHLGIIFTTKYK